MADDATGLVACLPSVFLGMDFGSLTEEERSCMMDAMAKWDATTLRGILSYEGISNEDYLTIAFCSSRELAGGVFGAYIELTDEEESCLREWMEGDRLEDHFYAHYSAEGFSGAYDCAPVMAVFEVLADARWYSNELSEEEWSCLREGVPGVDLSDLAALTFADGARVAVKQLIPHLVEDCLPDLFRLWESDDHPDEISARSEYTSLPVGEAVPGVLGYEADWDVFVLEAQEGEIYRIDVVRDTLPRPTCSCTGRTGSCSFAASPVTTHGTMRASPGGLRPLIHTTLKCTAMGWMGQAPTP